MNKKAISFLTEHRTALLTGVILAGMITLIGCLTDIYLGDESYHTLMAREWFLSGKRPVHLLQADYIPEHNHHRFFDADPLWHFGLFLLWKIRGVESKALAQIYQGFFYFFLLLGTYFLAREIYDKEIGKKALLVCATLPVMISFSIVLYIDVPLAAFSPWIFLLLLRENYLPAALLTGAMCLLKKNGIFLLPPLLSLVLFFPKFSRKNWLRIIAFGGIVLAILVPDLVWRLDHFQGILYPGDKGAVMKVLSRMVSPRTEPLPSISSAPTSPPGTPSSPSGPASTAQPYRVPRYIPPYIPEHLFSVKIILQYMGPLFLGGLLFYLFRIGKAFERKDILLLASAAIFVMLYLLFFKNAPAIRHLSPILPFLCMIAGKGWTALSRHRWIKLALFSLLLSQFLFTSLYIFKERRIPAGIAEGFRFIETNVAPGTRILYPEMNLAYYTKAVQIWERGFPRLKHLFWEETEQKGGRRLNRFQIRYILIKKSRIYDDGNIKDLRGYPRSFTDRIPDMAFLRLIFENQDVILLEVGLND